MASIGLFNVRSSLVIAAYTNNHIVPNVDVDKEVLPALVANTIAAKGAAAFWWPSAFGRRSPSIPLHGIAD